jgi:predicted component of type VI protein secretion system
MITLRLFKAADPFQEIESRVLAHGELTIGRDPACDWVILDQRRDLSRQHCTLSVEGDRVFLRDISTNGVMIGAEKRAVPRSERCELLPGETIYLGEFMILLDLDAPEEGAPDVYEKEAPVEALKPEPAVVKSSGQVTDAALLEAFCRGAGLEASSFAGEDPAGVMNRLGVAYRTIVDELCAMLRDRATLKDQLHMQRTTISARDNNPMKWAPPHRVAVDLLQEGDGGFLKGAAAFKASFADLRRHGVCLTAGSDAAIHFVLAQLEPDVMEANAKRHAMPFASKFEAIWKQFRDRHAALSEGAGDAAIERSFRQGYERRLNAIDDEEQAA